MRDGRAESAGSATAHEYVIVDGGKLAGTGAHSDSAGDATSGPAQAARPT